MHSESTTRERLARLLPTRRSGLALLALSTAILAFAPELDAQRRRRRQRPSGPAVTQQPNLGKKAEKKEKKKDLPKTAYIGAIVHLGNGTVLRGGTVLVEGDKILKVGQRIPLPKGTKTVDCKGRHISPGFVMVQASNLGAARSARGGKFADTIDPFNPSIIRALAVGITSYLNMGFGSSTLPGGESAVIKLLPDSIENAVVKEPAVYGMSAQLSPENWRKFTAAVKKAKQYISDKEAYDAKKAAGDKKAKAPKLGKSEAPIVAILSKKNRLQVRCSGDRKSLRQGVEISKLLGVPVTFFGTTEAWTIPDEIAATGSGCVLQPRIVAPINKESNEPSGSNIKAAKILYDSGIPCATTVPPGRFGGNGVGTGGILGRDLNTPFMDAAFAVRGGLSGEKALSTITLDAARLLGVDDRIGSLEPGKDADFLILDGDPLHYKTFVLQTIVNGKVRYEKNKHALYRKLGSR